MSFEKILNTAGNTLKKRGKQYGKARPLHENIAKRFTLVLEKKLAPGQSVTAYEVARLLNELKAARQDQAEFHEDSILDQICYLVIAYQLAGEETGIFGNDE